MLPASADSNADKNSCIVEPSLYDSYPESPSNKKQTFKSYAELETLLQAGKKKEVKLIIRENFWPLKDGVRSRLWPALCLQHAPAKNNDSFYWDMIAQMLGTTGMFIQRHFFFINDISTQLNIHMWLLIFIAHFHMTNEFCIRLYVKSIIVVVPIKPDMNFYLCVLANHVHVTLLIITPNCELFHSASVILRQTSTRCTLASSRFFLFCECQQSHVSVLRTFFHSRCDQTNQLSYHS